MAAEHYPRRDWEASDELRDQFLLDPQVAFLNHGSFGACPRPVLARQGELRTELEREPVSFLHRSLPARLREAREILSLELGCQAHEVVFTSNVTTALNAVLRSLPLQAGARVLVADHEYGALVRAWQAEAARRPLQIVGVHLALPVESPAAVVDAFARAGEGEAPETLLFVSHITSSTALRLPMAELLALAAQRGWRVLVDGAHAPGHLPLRLMELGVEAYGGNCHKWLMAPKGCGFLYADLEARQWLRPLVTSWGATNRPEAERQGAFLDELEWSGTMDPTPWLSLPAAVAFRKRWEWESRAALCRQRLQEWGEHCQETLGLRRISPVDSSLQMLALELPNCPLAAADLHHRLFEEHGVEVPTMELQGRTLLRVSLSPYNREADLRRLENGLVALGAVSSTFSNSH